MNLKKIYDDIIYGLENHYGLVYNKEHDFIHEFFEAEEVPLFKIVFGHKEAEDKQVIVATFHIDLNPVDAIQWFLRIHKLYPPIRLQECYIKDARGETFLGTQAEALKQLLNEQDVLEDWAADKEDAKAYVKAKIYGRRRVKNKPFFSDVEAMLEFNKMVKPEDDECH